MIFPSAVRPGFAGGAGEVGNHVLQVAGFHGIGHVAFRLLDSLSRHFQGDDRRTDLIGMFFNQGLSAFPHESFGRTI